MRFQVLAYTVPFRIVHLSRITGPVDVDEIGQLSHVTAKVAGGLMHSNKFSLKTPMI